MLRISVETFYVHSLEVCYITSCWSISCGLVWKLLIYTGSLWKFLVPVLPVVDLSYMVELFHGWEILIKECMYQSTHPSIYLSVHLSIHPSVCLSVRPSVRLSIHPSIHPSIHQSIHPINPSISVVLACHLVYYYYCSYVTLNWNINMMETVQCCTNRITGPSSVP